MAFSLAASLSCVASLYYLRYFSLALCFPHFNNNFFSPLHIQFSTRNETRQSSQKAKRDIAWEKACIEKELASMACEDLYARTLRRMELDQHLQATIMVQSLLRKRQAETISERRKVLSMTESQRLIGRKILFVEVNRLSVSALLRAF